MRFANPSPPSGWIEDFHLQAVDHARHTYHAPAAPGVVRQEASEPVGRLHAQEPDEEQKHAVTREEVYKFAWGCIKQGRPEPAAVAVVCFEWLQRPENVVGGLLTWSDYRSNKWPHAVRIEHHKNKALVWHPLEETVDGEIVKFYAEAEDILNHLPKLGIPMIMRRTRKVSARAMPKYGPIPAWKRWCSSYARKLTACRSCSRSTPAGTAA
ncbi:MAG: hypothetical protein IT537_29155 [Hyphomicrobiales bacterium]|nr:hypothetical protein [Hyphomicrobiales bacterium]